MNRLDVNGGGAIIFFLLPLGTNCLSTPTSRVCVDLKDDALVKPEPPNPRPAKKQRTMYVYEFIDDETSQQVQGKIKKVDLFYNCFEETMKNEEVVVYSSDVCDGR